jgi:ligand-binding sensor domain-containing protein
LWLAKGGHLSVFRNGKFQPLLDYPQLGSVRVAASRSGGVWISSGTNIWSYREGGDLQAAGNLPPGVTASALLEDHAGALWIGSPANGLFRRDDSGIEKMPSSHHQIDCVFEGREGNIWVGTHGGGMDRLRPRAVQLIGTEEGLPFESIQSVCQDSSGAIWVATHNGVLARNHGTNWSVLSQGTNWPGGNAACVASDTSGAVWIGTGDRGLVRFQNDEFKTWHTRDGLASENIRGLLVTSNGDVWVTSSGHLQRLRQGTFETVPLPVHTRYLRALAEDAQGDVWGGTSEGSLFRIHDTTLTDETMPIQGGPASIRCLYTASDGALWMGYAGFGLGRFKDGKYARITTREGLHNNFLSQIVADKLDRVWLAGNGGIFQVSLEELNRVADDVASGHKTRLRSVLYG